jgi:adenylosuccinate lyase
MEAGAKVKKEGKENDLVDRIASDPEFGMTKEMIEEVLEPKNFVGRAPQQTEEFIAEVVKPVLDANRDVLGMVAEINV